MAVNRWQVLLFLAAGLVAAFGVAYVAGVLDPYLAGRSAPPVAQSPVEPAPATQAPAPQAPATAKDEPSQPAAQEPEAAAAEPEVPVFDIVRVEPDGGIVVAGKALPDSTVELFSGDEIIGTGQADANGHFAIVPDVPLKPGDYQLGLRSLQAGAPALTSEETAVVSVPATPNGEVLAMVEKPGEASRVMIAPGSSTPSAQETDDGAQPAATPPPGQAAPSGQTPDASVVVEAVEIEGEKIFVAGKAEPGRTVRVYADELLIGEAVVAPSGRFLVDAERELPVGDYTIRADVLGDDGKQVVARAAVPFERKPGEAIAAVAPDVLAGAQAQRAAGVTGEAESARAEPLAAGATAPELQPSPSKVIIRRGDTLWHISRRVYGRGVRYSTIYLANKDQIKNPDLIWPGQVFSVPDHTEEGEAADFQTMGGQAPGETNATVQ